MTATTDVPRPAWRTAALMGVSGGMFVGLAAATRYPPAWVAAAAINVIAAAEALLRWQHAPSPVTPAAACVG